MTPSDATLLTEDEMQLWHAWKMASESVNVLLARDLAEATGLSPGDYGVLSRLLELGKGELRQQALADSLRWDKSRLSHQLTRMRERGFIEREASGKKGFTVRLTAAGKKALKGARPAHANAIRARLLDKLPQGSRGALLKALEAIAAGEP